MARTSCLCQSRARMQPIFKRRFPKPNSRHNLQRCQARRRPSCPPTRNESTACLRRTRSLRPAKSGGRSYDADRGAMRAGEMRAGEGVGPQRSLAKAQRDPDRGNPFGAQGPELNHSTGVRPSIDMCVCISMAPLWSAGKRQQLYKYCIA